MNDIKLNHSYRKVKGLVLLLITAMVPLAINFLTNATTYFDLLKGLLCACVAVGSIFIYVHLEKIDPELDEVKAIVLKSRNSNDRDEPPSH